MRTYDMLLIVDPRLTDEEVAQLSTRLQEGLTALGGVATLLLTHRDDAADHEAYAREFGCVRVMHGADGARRLGVERVLEGTGPVALDAELLAIPTPGHTRGHTVFLYRDRSLFTGDHLAWSPEDQALVAYPDVCWYSWEEQTRSMERLLAHRFEWVLPGHGRTHCASAAAMHAHLERCIARMRARTLTARHAG